MSYEFLKWLHIVAIISWMAGLLYLFRLFVYHVSHGEKSSDNHALLSIMERKLFQFITVPAMALAWIAGLSLLHIHPILMRQGWLHGKLLCVILLTCITFYAGHLRKGLSRVEGTKKPTLTVGVLKMINEVPTVLMMIIVALVVFRPFN
ncbi:MAG: CopD family protein [Oligoflexales bacterium]|nr:CopD family protein [Oligoflexales bacterium]